MLERTRVRIGAYQDKIVGESKTIKKTLWEADIMARCLEEIMLHRSFLAPL